jgi:hypothetical protein
VLAYSLSSIELKGVNGIPEFALKIKTEISLLKASFLF